MSFNNGNTQPNEDQQVLNRNLSKYQTALNAEIQPFIKGNQMNHYQEIFRRLRFKVKLSKEWLNSDIGNNKTNNSNKNDVEMLLSNAEIILPELDKLIKRCNKGFYNPLDYAEYQILVKQRDYIRRLRNHTRRRKSLVDKSNRVAQNKSSKKIKRSSNNNTKSNHTHNKQNLVLSQVHHNDDLLEYENNNSVVQPGNLLIIQQYGNHHIFTELNNSHYSAYGQQKLIDLNDAKYSIRYQQYIKKINAEQLSKQMAQMEQFKQVKEILRMDFKHNLGYVPNINATLITFDSGAEVLYISDPSKSLAASDYNMPAALMMPNLSMMDSESDVLFYNQKAFVPKLISLKQHKPLHGKLKVDNKNASNIKQQIDSRSGDLLPSMPMLNSNINHNGDDELDNQGPNNIVHDRQKPKDVILSHKNNNKSRRTIIRDEKVKKNIYSFSSANTSVSHDQIIYQQRINKAHNELAQAYQELMQIGRFLLLVGFAHEFVEYLISMQLLNWIERQSVLADVVNSDDKVIDPNGKTPGTAKGDELTEPEGVIDKVANNDDKIIDPNGKRPGTAKEDELNEPEGVVVDDKDDKAIDPNSKTPVGVKKDKQIAPKNVIAKVVNDDDKVIDPNGKQPGAAKEDELNEPEGVVVDDKDDKAIDPNSKTPVGVKKDKQIAPKNVIAKMANNDGKIIDPNGKRPGTAKEDELNEPEGVVVDDKDDKVIDPDGKWPGTAEGDDRLPSALLEIALGNKLEVEYTKGRDTTGKMMRKFKPQLKTIDENKILDDDRITNQIGDGEQEGEEHHNTVDNQDFVPTNIGTAYCTIYAPPDAKKQKAVNHSNDIANEGRADNLRLASKL